MKHFILTGRSLLALVGSLYLCTGLVACSKSSAPPPAVQEAEEAQPNAPKPAQAAQGPQQAAPPVASTQAMPQSSAQQAPAEQDFSTGTDAAPPRPPRVPPPPPVRSGAPTRGADMPLGGLGISGTGFGGGGMGEGLGGLGKGSRPSAPQHRDPSDAPASDTRPQEPPMERMIATQDVRSPPPVPGAGVQDSPPAAPEPEDVTTAAPEPDVPLPGQILFNPPQRMRLGKGERVEVRVVQNTQTDLTQNLRGSGAPIVEQHKVSKIMRVNLTGEKFDIVPLSEVEQVVTRDDFTEWSFTVTPQESGNHPLHLAVTMVLDIPGRGEKAKTLPVIDRPILVEVDSYFMASSFAKENWEWLASGVLLPVAAWGAEHMRRKRRRLRKEARERSVRR